MNIKNIGLIILVSLSFFSCKKNEEGQKIINKVLGREEDRPNKKKNSKSNEVIDEAEILRCASICDSFAVLKNIKENSFNSFLDFDNFSHRRIGQCRGHSIVNQRFTYLARYAPKEQSACLPGIESIECEQYLTELFEEMNNYKVVTFKGFESLNDLSKHPNGKDLLRWEIIKVPHKYSTLPSKIERTDDYRRIDVFHETVKRVKENKFPYLALKGSEVGNHALIAYGLAYIGQKEVICFRDPNFVPKVGFEDCQNFAYIEGNNVMYVRESKPASSLWRFELFKDEDQRTVDFINANRRYCISDNYEKGLCHLTYREQRALNKKLKEERDDQIDRINTEFEKDDNGQDIKTPEEIEVNS